MVLPLVYSMLAQMGSYVTELEKATYGNMHAILLQIWVLLIIIGWMFRNHTFYGWSMIWKPASYIGKYSIKFPIALVCFRDGLEIASGTSTYDGLMADLGGRGADCPYVPDLLTGDR